MTDLHHMYNRLHMWCNSPGCLSGVECTVGMSSLQVLAMGYGKQRVGLSSLMKRSATSLSGDSDPFVSNDDPAG